jgi:DNA-binding NarL/FixJ family response regulator
LIEILTYIKALQKSDEKHELQLKYLTEDFDALVHKQFNTWDLTAAEKDIALFMLRGLNNIEIAGLRKVAVGTIRVQSHRILQKAGVSSRTELMSIFMEEFMDVGYDSSANQKSN